MDKATEHWLRTGWRPALAWAYVAICIFDFIIAPIIFTFAQKWEIRDADFLIRQWLPLTLGSGGLFHLAMGAVLGVAAYGRTQEKIKSPTPE